jgi:hypothetical protein
MNGDYSAPPDEIVEDIIERAQAEGVDPLTLLDTEDAFANVRDLDLFRSEDDALHDKQPIRCCLSFLGSESPGG